MEEPKKHYGTIAPNPTTDNLIYDCFELFKDEDQQEFVKKFKEQGDDEDQVNHTLRELIVGTYIARLGFDPHYEPTIGSKTPEWLFVQKETGERLVVELVNIHMKHTQEQEMKEAMKTGNSYCYWMEPNTKRLYGKIQDKMAKYKKEIEDEQLHYIVAVFGLFSSALNTDEVKECLEGEDGLFPLYPGVTGVLFFKAAGSEYRFEYLQNPNAARQRIQLSNGSLAVKAV